MRRISYRLLAAASVLLVASAAGAATRPHYGGTLRVELRARVASLDPREWPADPVEAAATEKLAALLFDRLVRLDDRGQPEPALAVSWEHDSAAKRWQFRLRVGVKFHDGTPLTPAAVAAAWQGEGNPLGKDRLASVSGEWLVIESGRAMPDLPAELAVGRSLVFHVTAEGGITGTGPFRVAEWQPRRHLVVAANEDCWAGRPFLDSITVELGVAPPQQIVDLELGKADLVEVAPDHARRTAQSGARTWSSSPVELLALVFDPQRPAVQDARLRRALALSIDRAAIWNFLLQKQGEIAGGLLPQWISGYAFLFPTAPDVERAKPLRAELSPSPPLVLAYDSGDALARAVAERIAVNAREVGITMQITAPAPASTTGYDVRLVRLRLAPGGARTALESLLAVLGEPSVLLPGAPPTPEQLYAAELTVVQTYRVVPLAHLPETFGLSAQIKNWMPRRWGAWRLDDAWLETTAPPTAAGNKL